MSRDDEERPDGDGRPVDGESFSAHGGPFSADDIVIPDDLRELDAEVRALRRERRVQARKAGLRRLFLTRRWRQYGISGPIVIGVLLVVAGMASLMLMFPARRPVAKPVPLATGVRESGQEGGLVPDVAIHRADGTAGSLRDVRPAVVVLLPAACDCDRLLHTYGAAAFRHHLTFVLVGGELPAGLTDREAVRAADPTGRLARVYGVGRDPVLLLVRGDGVVNRMLLAEAEPTASALDSELAVLVTSGSSGSG